MAEFSYVIDAAHDGVSVKDYLKKELGLSTRTIIALKKIPRGILIGGEHARSVDILRENDVLSLNTPEESTDYEVSYEPVDIVHEDENFLLVNKDFGSTVYKCGEVERNLHSAVAGYYQKQGKNVVFRPFYRLDKDTTGIVVVAKNGLVMKNTELRKDYYAVCEGEVPEEGIKVGNIALCENSRIKRRVVTEGGEYAETHFWRIAFDGKHSLVKFNLVTGRTHQIRVHMSDMGHPLAGDDLYGGSLEFIPRQALHCKSVSLNNKALSLEGFYDTEFPDDMKKAFSGLIG